VGEGVPGVGAPGDAELDRPLGVGQGEAEDRVGDAGAGGGGLGGRGGGRGVAGRLAAKGKEGAAALVAGDAVED